MRRQILTSAALLAGLASGQLAYSQQPVQQDSVTVMQAGVDRLKEDIKYVVHLAPKGAANWKNISDLLDVFIGGIDTAQPIRVDIILGANRDTRMWFPVAKGQEGAFRDNVKENVGKPGRKLTTAGDFWEWKGPGLPEGGYQRDIKGWSVLAANRANLPAGLTNPLGPIAPLTAAGYDVAGLILNSASGRASRIKQIQTVRDELTAKIKRLGDEDEYEFELRKLSHQQQMDEAQRFYSDSENLTLGWTLDTEKKQARLDLKLVALAGSDLEKSIQMLAVEPSHFAGATRSDKTTFFGRINHAIDPMRQAHAKAFLGVIRNQAKARIPASTNIKDTHKESYAQAADKFIDVLLAGIDMGVFDGFVHVEKPNENHTLIGGVRVPDGAALLPVLELLKGAEWDVALNTETSNDLSLHVIKIPQRDDHDFSALFGKESTLVVGTSKNAIWYAAGANAAERLKSTAATLAAAEKKADGVFVEMWANLGPWMQFLLERRDRKAVDVSKLSDDDKRMRKTKEELLKTAIEAFKPGDGIIEMKIERQKNEVFGRTILHEGTLRFGGMKIVDFAEKRLQ